MLALASFRCLLLVHYINKESLLLYELHKTIPYTFM
nr:MAG TPA: hypothetical protein [Caudoviricetes sp.]